MKPLFEENFLDAFQLSRFMGTKQSLKYQF